jgi:hypothetical protein
VTATIRGCPDQPERFDEGCLGSRSFEETWRGFKRYRGQRVVYAGGTGRGCYERAGSSGGCRVIRVHNLHCVRDYVGGVER